MTRDDSTTDSTKEESEDSALEETTREKLGVERWDRPLIFRETADAATDIRFPYWSMLLLSGAIATLGLALDNAAVVIGAMLIAPLLAPTMGLALALAMGDLRLASQTGIAVVVSTVLVIVAALLLTVVLPFQTFTSEITARTRPTTLDLAIAVFSGLAGAVVSVTRRKGLSAAIPGVAVAVALLPPIAVAGFSMGAGFHWSFIKGSLLLYGANLAGIVFSGTAVFLLIGMHRPDVVKVARKWHADAEPTRLAAWAARTRWLPTIGSIRSPKTRIGIVFAFVAALAVPLTITLGEIARETRVHRSIRGAADVFDVEGRSSVLNIRPVVGDTTSQAIVRVATTEWFGSEAKETFERVASDRAGEPIRLVLEQVPTSTGGLEELAAQLGPGGQAGASDQPTELPALSGPVRDRIDVSIGGLMRPDSVHFVGSALTLASTEEFHLSVGYTAPQPFGAGVQSLLTRQLRSSLAAPELVVDWERVAPDTVSISGTHADSTRFRAMVDPAFRYGRIDFVVLADTSRDRAAADSIRNRMVRLGLRAERIRIRHVPGSDLRVGSLVRSP